MKRPVYLEKMEWKRAFQKLREKLRPVFPLGSESVPVIDSLRRISISDVVACMNSPLMMLQRWMELLFARK